MAKKIISAVGYMFVVCILVEYSGIKYKFLDNLSRNFTKNSNSYYDRMYTGVKNLRNELEKKEVIWSQPDTQIEHPEPFTSFNSPRQNSENKKNFFVITAIFNPASYQSRQNLYLTFVRHMNHTGAQLVTIECIFPSLNQTEFQVTEANNPWHIQLKSESVYWMKENLINIAVSRLPPHAKWVCWLDADIEFENPNWVELTIQELQKYTVVQMFDKAHSLGPAPENEILRTDYSFGYSVVHNKTIDTMYYKMWYPHPGYGWAMSVNDFRMINGLPYYCIAGSGDHFFAYSLLDAKSYPFGKYEKKLHHVYLKMTIDKLNLNFIKLKEVAESNEKEIVGYIPATIKHHWHGSKMNRRYLDRWEILSGHQFNFEKDVTINIDGLLQFNPNSTALQQSFVQYFETRKEDFNNTHESDTKRVNFS